MYGEWRMATSVVPHSLSALRAALQYHLNCAESIKVAIDIASSFDSSINPRQYTGKSKAVALAEYLDERGGQATREECLQALKLGGCDLGARPEANISTVITTNRGRFAWKGDRVFLVSRKMA
jgi:hypothetical protein